MALAPLKTIADPKLKLWFSADGAQPARFGTGHNGLEPLRRDSFLMLNRMPRTTNATDAWSWKDQDRLRSGKWEIGGNCPPREAACGGASRESCAAGSAGGAIWDNRAIVHCALNDYAGERLLHRVTFGEDRAF